MTRSLPRLPGAPRSRLGARVPSLAPAAALALLLAVLPSAPAAPLHAQVSLEGSTTGTALRLRALDGVKRVLMIAAHPDDEDTALLTALSRGMGVTTAYLSLTRGDGGQNLIGPELGEGLGVVRTGELVAARQLDGGTQFFTRAFDYGFSKSADEALSTWPREELLRDVVYVIRKYQPQVIVSVFSGTPADGHGQHQAAGIMAVEAFGAAADPGRFPELATHGVEPWQAAKLYQRPRGLEPTHEVETGAFDPLLGRSHFQLAMESRSQHRSQDMGVPQPTGGRVTGLILLATAPGLEAETGAQRPVQGLFAGVDTTLAAGIDDLDFEPQIPVRSGIERYRRHLSAAASALTPVSPWAAAPHLVEARRGLQAAAGAAVAADPDAPITRNLVDRLVAVNDALLQAAGVTFRVVASDDLVVPGESFQVTLELWNGGDTWLEGVRPLMELPGGWTADEVELPDLGSRSGFFGREAPVTQLTAASGLEPGSIARWRYRVTVPENADVSRLYFRRAPRDGAMYRWPGESDAWGLPKDPPLLRASTRMTLATESGARGVPVEATAPAVYVGVDKALGEFTKPLLVVPALSVATETGSMAWPQGSDETREVRVTVSSQAVGARRGEIRLEAPEGWEVSPGQTFDLTAPGAQTSAVFQVRAAGAQAGTHTFRAVAETSSGDQFTEQLRLIDYPHIERTPMLDAAELRVSVVPVRVADVRVGYLMGSGDGGLLALRQMGVEVREVTPADLTGGVPGDLDVLVLGIRVYETQPQAASVNDQILNFARGGGTVVVQYNKYEYPAGGFAPYEVSMGRPAPRVTDEASPVEIVDPASPVIDGPNRITEADFEGWVQERGLYFIREWDQRYRTPLAFTDPGEEPALGSLLVAPVGEGVYVYTGISFFRQFPAAVPGAYRLFANLVSLRGVDLR